VASPPLIVALRIPTRGQPPVAESEVPAKGTSRRGPYGVVVSAYLTGPRHVSTRCAHRYASDHAVVQVGAEGDDSVRNAKGDTAR
jgi:hypothetical protein